MPDVVVKITKNFDAIDISVNKLRKLVTAVCSRYARDDMPRGLRTRQKAPAAARYEISIAIVDDAQIRRLNRRFLNRNTVTDCLSFDLSDRRDEKSFELVVNAQKAVRQAARRGHCAGAEVALYVLHGLLHNLGFDDSTRAGAKKMHSAEDEILRQQGYGRVYNEAPDKACGSDSS